MRANVVKVNNTAWVDKKIMDAMTSESNCWCPKETGGVLVGYWSNHDVVITDIIGPGPKAEHRRYSFAPDTKWQEHEIARIYEQSGRIHTYLGDWHSHPYGNQQLSVKDLITLFRVAVHKPARAPSPIMGVLHNNPQWELAVWRFAYSKVVSGNPYTAMKVVWFDGKVG
jgi:integrative and conjugative element protein (TIGR02256 family)